MADREAPDALPEVVYVRDLAAWLRTSEKAIRDRVRRGQLPRPGRIGRRCAWSRAAIVAWAREHTVGQHGSRGPRVTLRPYFKDRSRFHVDLHYDDPAGGGAARKRLVAPRGLSERQARQWGMGALAKLLRAPAEAPADPAPAAASEKHETTLERFYGDDFAINYLALQRPATQAGYASLWRHHLSALGPFPLRAIDERVVDGFVAGLKRKGLRASTINFALAKLARVLRWARKHRAIDALPDIETIKVERAERPHYTTAELDRLRAAFGGLSAEDAAVFLLAFEAGLRTGEIAALRWEDIDLEHGVVKVRRTLFRGSEGPPKGTVGEVGLTNNLRAALARLERRGLRVLYRRSHVTGGEYAEHTEHSVKAALHRMQRAAGLGRTGLHILRHSGITFLAERGADVHTLKAFARHSRLQTTEVYVHTSKQRLARAAALLFDADAGRTSR